MEESEKRRERLKAMRIEAAHAGANNSENSASQSLSNPLIETENAMQYTSPRFDYYTDPMAAFSGRRRTDISPQVSQGHYNPPPRPVYQGMTPPPAYPPPGPRMFQYPNPQFSQSPPPGPMEPPRPWGGPPRNPPNSNPHFNQSPPPGPMEPPRPWGGPPRNPPNSWRGPHGNPPRSWGGHQGNFNYGRGRGRSQGVNSGPGTSGGRGGGPRRPISAEERPDLYYKKEMVEDPWKDLEPVVWKGVPGQNWLPKSISLKKAKVSQEAASSKTSASQPSLAEYLAATFTDSKNEAVGDEQGS